jgi:hypothetical protein
MEEVFFSYFFLPRANSSGGLGQFFIIHNYHFPHSPVEILGKRLVSVTDQRADFSVLPSSTLAKDSNNLGD